MMKHLTLPKQVSQSRGLVLILRPKQWVKNGFVLAPLIFTGTFLNPGALKSAVWAMALFCVGSSAVYILNDLNDIERDRLHPKKSKSRPLAAGMISKGSAISLLILLIAVVCANWFFIPQVVSVVFAYLILNVAYTFHLKHQPVVDIFTIAIGFVLRVYAGAVALDVKLSEWMFVTTLCLALYLAAIKRRQELKTSGKEGREVLVKYSIGLVDRYAEMSATGAVVFYSLFVMQAKPQMVLTIPLVLFGLYRYWYVVEELDGGESPTEALLADWPLLATVVLWVIACIITLIPLGS